MPRRALESNPRRACATRAAVLAKLEVGRGRFSIVDASESAPTAAARTQHSVRAGATTGHNPWRIPATHPGSRYRRTLRDGERPLAVRCNCRAETGVGSCTRPDARTTDVH